MLPDTIEYGEWKSGIRTESSLYGFMTFAQKGAIAIAVFILGIALTNIGFEPNQEQSSRNNRSFKELDVYYSSYRSLYKLCLALFLSYR